MITWIVKITRFSLSVMLHIKSSVLHVFLLPLHLLIATVTCVCSPFSLLRVKLLKIPAKLQLVATVTDKS